MAHDVFVSHSVKDKAVAEAIVARLEAESVTCWIAPRDVMPGADWGESIIDAIESSRIMILIFSQSANTSTQIKREVERAVNKGVYIIPFRVDDIPPTRSLEYFISTSQWMDAFSPPLERHLDTLAKTVTAVLKRPPLPAAHVPAQPEKTSIPTPPIPPSRRKSILIAATIAALVIVGGAGWYLVQKKKGPPEKSVVTPIETSTLVPITPAVIPTVTTTPVPVTPASAPPVPTLVPIAVRTPTTPPISSAQVAQSAEPTVAGEENTYSGQVGSSEATFRLRFGLTGRVSGTYTQNGRTFRLEGQNPTGKLLRSEERRVGKAGRIERTRKSSDEHIGWEGTMHNTPPDNRSFPVCCSRQRVAQSAEPTVVGEENTYSGQVGSSEATFRLRFEPTGRVSGTYTQNGRTFRLEGQNPTGKLL